MLETIRDYAAEQLEQLGKARELRGRHAEYYLRVASSVDGELRGPDQEAWMARVGEQHSNFAAAMTFYTEEGPPNRRSGWERGWRDIGRGGVRWPRGER